MKQTTCADRFSSNNEFNVKKFKKQLARGRKECQLIKVISTTDSNINDKIISSLQPSGNLYNINDKKKNVTSTNMSKRKHHDSQNSNVISNHDQNLGNDSAYIKSRIEHETSIITNYLDHGNYVYEEKKNFTSKENEKIKHYDVQNEKSRNNSNLHQNSINETQNINAQITHETSIVTKYFDQFDSFMMQQIQSLKARKL